MFFFTKKPFLNRHGLKNKKGKVRTTRQPAQLGLEKLENLVLPAAIPTVTFVNDPPTSQTDLSFTRLETKPFIGEDNQFTLRFQNASPTDVGFTPYVDLYMPVTGVDGAGAAVDDGITFVSATYLGTTLKATTVTLVDGAVGVNHPFAKNPDGTPRKILLADHPGFKAGDQLVVLETPLGSFTPSQPPLDIVVTTHVSNLADVGAPLKVQAQGGFRFGGDPLDNPAIDPPILGATTNQDFTPSLYRFTKENLAPEYETATGPNFVQQYRLRLDVATGQTITDVKFNDVLPGNLQFVSVVSLTGGTESIPDRLTPSTVVSGGTLQRVLQSVTGTSSETDAQLVFSYFVPIRDVGNAVIINANSGDDVTIPNSATLTADWVPIDLRDPATPISETVNTTGPLGVWDPEVEHPLVAKSIATQKSISTPPGGAIPGSTVTYTIRFQISDYFAFQNLVLTDLLGDGQELVPGSSTLSVADAHTASGTTSGVIDAANLTYTPNKPGTNGKDEIVFRISDELIQRGFSNGRLVGGMIPLGGTGGATMPNQPAVLSGTTGTITFQAKLLESFAGTVPSGDKPLNPNDLVDNSETIQGDLLSVNDITTPTGQSEADDSYAWTRVPPTSFTKSIYARNGVIGTYPSDTLVNPGDTITYHLKYNVPISDAENLKIKDFLPLPIFDVDDLGTGIVAQDIGASGTNNAPAAGKWSYTTADTFHAIHGGLLPTVTNTSSANSVTFDYGTLQDVTNTPGTIDLLFTVTANSQPYADQLLLANRAFVSANNSANELDTHEAIAAVTSSEPELAIKKGVVATDNPAGKFTPTTIGPVPFSAPGSVGTRFTGTITSTNLASKPINSNLSEVDADDLVTYAIVIENKGSGSRGAFDVVIKDTPSAGMAIPGFGPGGINLRVTNGAGVPLPFNIVGAGLFEGGIELVDPSANQGAIGRGKDSNGNVVTDGSNIVIVTYDMQVLDNRVLAPLVNTGAVTQYAARPGGPDFTGTGSLEDPATVTVGTDNLLAKQLISTEIVNSVNANNEGVIGELVTYQVTIRMPEANMPNAVLTDTLDSRLAFVGMDSVTVSPDITLSGSTTPVVTNSGNKLTFNLGNVVNSNRDNTTAETITFVYKAVILNKSNAQGGNQVQNKAELKFDGLNTPKSARAAAVTIIEPEVQVTKSAQFDTGDPATGDADDPVTYTIVLKNPGGSQAATADAFDLVFSDPLPKVAGGSLIVSPTFTVVDSAGIVTAGDFELVGNDLNGYTLQNKAGTTFDLPVSNSRTITIKIQGMTPTAGSGLVVPGTVFTNNAKVTWTSLDGDPGQRSTYNSSSVERDGSGGFNDYIASSAADLRLIGLGFTKSIVSTSENATSSQDRVVVGEIVRYRLVAVVPEGSVSTTSLQFLDQLPSGLQFLNDGTAKVALVSNGGLNSSLIPGGTTAYVTGGTATGVTPDFILPSGTILGAPFVDGTDVSFDLGQVTNQDTDLNDEFIVIEYNALVTNVVSNNVVNQVGNELINKANLIRDAVPTGQTSSTVVRLAEPNLRNFEKLAVQNDDTTPAAGPFDAGDMVRYQVHFGADTGQDNSVGYDVRLVDNLPAGKMTLVPDSVRVYRNGTLITTGVIDFSGTTLVDVTLDVVNPGDDIKIFYDTVLTNAVEVQTFVPNSAHLTASSIPGPNGTVGNPTGSVVPGLPGSPSGERNGMDGPGGALNDYAAVTGTTIQIASPQIDKTIFDTSPVETNSNQFDPDLADFTVGELVTYRLAVTLPEGTTPSMVISDLLPGLNAQMKYVSSHIVSIGNQITGSSLIVGDTGTYNSGLVTFNFGTVINQADGLQNNEDKIIIDVDVQVLNVSQNVAGAKLTNSGLLQYKVGADIVLATSLVTSEIVEPVLTTNKEIVQGLTTVDTTSADAGDIITYRVTIQHAPNSTGPAFTVKLADTLPAGLELIPSSVNIIKYPQYPSSFFDEPVIQTNVGGNPNAFNVIFDYIDHPDNDFALGKSKDTAVVEYQAKVTTAVTPGTLVTNTANLTYDSLYTERSSALFPDTTRAYSTSDPASVTVNTNSVAGSVFVDANRDHLLTPGETLLPGVSVALVGTDHLGQPVSLTTTTDGNGAYLFSNLRPGNYQVIETQPVGYVSNGEQPGTPFGNGSTGENHLGVLIPTGANTPNAGTQFDFAEVLPAAISGFVYYDKNNNGIFEAGELPIGGVSMTLTGTNFYGAISSVTVVTAGDGSYQYQGLLPGTYSVSQIQPAGYLDGKVTPGSTGGSGAVPNLISSIIVAPADSSINNNFGELLPSSLSGQVYVDNNTDGIRNPGEPPIANVRIDLTGTDDRGNPVSLTTFTNGNGLYSFDTLRPGVYQIKQTQPAGYQQGMTIVGSEGGDNSVLDLISQINLKPGTDGVHYDFNERGLRFDKTVVATSENATTDPSKVVVGEIVRYRLVAAVPEGIASTSSYRFTDQIPVGMQFLNDGTSKIAFISNGGFTSSVISAGAAFVTGGSATGVTPTSPLPGTSIVGGPFGDGTDVSFDLGAVTNNDNDPNEEFIVVEYNALVLNVSPNIAGKALTNGALITRDTFPSGQTTSTTVTVAEPNLTNLTKTSVKTDDTTAAPGPFDGGDVLRYRVSATAETGANRSTAYDVRFLDNLPSTQMTLVPATIRVLRNGNQINSGFTNNSTSTTIDVVLDQVAPGDSIVLLYDTKLTNAVAAQTSVPNTVNLTASSIPGPNGTTGNPTGSIVPGTPGSSTGERNGTDGPGGALNNYASVTGTSVLIAGPRLEKSIFETSPIETQSNQFDPALVDFAIGEFVTYHLTVTLQEGTTPSLVIKDLLPVTNGRMQYLSSKVFAIGSQITGSALSVGSPGSEAGGVVTFNLGTVVNQADGLVNAGDQIVLEVKAQVMNVTANIAGTTITNTGRMDYKVGPNTITTDSTVTSDIVEPKLVTTKEIVSGTTTVDTKALDAGDIVTYRVTVKHDATSTAPAFSVKIADTLPVGLALIPSSIKVIHHPDYPSVDYDQPVISTNVGGNANAFSVLFDYLDNPANPLAVGGGNDIAVIEYQATVTTAVPAGATLINTAHVTYDSLYGEVPSTTSPQTTRDYNTSDISTVTVNTNSVAGSVFVDANRDHLLTPGETLLPGVTIALVGTDHLGQPVSLTTTTDGNGAYLFSNLRPGDYQVIETQPVGYVSNGEQPGNPFGNGTTGENHLGALIPKGTNTPNAGTQFDFAEVLPAAISGFVYYDKNNNGIFEAGEPPIGGVSMTLTGTNFYGAISSVTVFTAADGSYHYQGLLPGTYSVSQIQPAGYLDGKVTPGSTGGDGSVNNLISSIIVAPADSSVSNNFGELLPSSLAGQVYVDINKNGSRDPGEQPIGNVKITLTGVDDRGNPVSLETKTATDGSYSFNTLRPGTYEIKQTQPPGFIQGLTLIGSEGGTSPVKDLITSIDLRPGTDGIHYDFSEFAKPADPLEPGNPLVPGKPLTPVIPPSKQQFLNGSPDLSWILKAPTQPNFTKFNPNNVVGSAAFLVTGSGVGSGLVRVFDYGGNIERFRFRPYANPNIAVRVAKGDVTGDGVPDFVTAPGAGMDPIIKVYDGNNGKLVKSFLAYAKGYTQGVNIAVGDTNGDGKAEILTGTDYGATPHVKLFNGTTGGTLQSFYAYATSYRGGVNVAIGDSNGDGNGDLVTAAAVGAPHVIIRNAADLAVQRSFYAGSSLDKSGVSIAVADLNGDGKAEVIAAAGRGANSGRIQIYDGATNTLTKSTKIKDAAFGLMVATQDVNMDGRPEIFVSNGKGGLPKVRALDGLTLNELDFFYADDPRFIGGISVG